MKKTSLFILLILLTFSLSQSNFKIHFQSKQAYIGIREGNKIEDFINKKMKLPNEKKKIIKSGVEGIGFQDMFVSSSFSPRITAKLREIQINGLYFFLEELKLITNIGFILFLFIMLLLKDHLNMNVNVKVDF